MKQITLLLMFILWTSNSWTQELEPINIPKETKIEVVLTLNAYPLVLDKVELTENLLDASNRINDILEQQLESKDVEIHLLKSKENNYLEQLKLINRQLKKEKLKAFKIGGIGIATVIALIVIK